MSFLLRLGLSLRFTHRIVNHRTMLTDVARPFGRQLVWLPVLVALCGVATAAHAATLTVTANTDAAAVAGGYPGEGPGQSGDLRYAILNSSAGDTIQFNCGGPCLITLNGPLPPITHNLTINGGQLGNVIIDGNSHFRVFFVDIGTVTLENLVIRDGKAQGGNGGNGGIACGGGGAGLGGGLFVNGVTANAAVTVSDVFFTGDSAAGGNGCSVVSGNGSGGGGGLGGNGGNGGNSSGTYTDGGGGGVIGAGANGNNTNLNGVAGGLGGGGGSDSNGSNTSSGGSGAPGYGTNGAGSGGSVATAGNGGLGGGGGAAVQQGGEGGFGGGGGGAQSFGGNGGPGGGGGGCESSGCAISVGGILVGAVAGGHGASGGGSGGGAAAGADIFVNQGTLIIENSDSEGANASGGIGGSGAGSGTADATPVFNYAGIVNDSSTTGPIASALNVGSTLTYGPLNLGTANVCPAGSSSSAPCSQTGTAAFSYDLTQNLTSLSIKVLTQGAVGLDFTDAGTGTCNSLSMPLSSGSTGTCTVDVKFAPTHPGVHLGAFELLDQNGNMLAMDLLSGTGTGPQVAFFSNSGIQQIGSGFVAPGGIAVDASGDVFVGETGTSPNKVMEIVASGGKVSSTSAVIQIASSFTFNYPYGLAVDGNGDLFVADYNNAVEEIVAVNGKLSSSSSVIVLNQSPLAGATGVAVDRNGNVFVAEEAKGAVYEVLATDGMVSNTSQVIQVGSGFTNPYSVAMAGNGDLLVADASGAVYEVANANGSFSSSSLKVAVGSGFGFPGDMAEDAAGDLFVTNVATNLLSGAIVEVQAANGAVSSSSKVLTLNGGFTQPRDLAIDANGNIFVADIGSGKVEEIPVAPSLSLSFAAAAVGVTSSPQTVTLQNIGNATLTFPIPATGYDPSVSTNFTYDNSSTCLQNDASAAMPFTLAAGASCTVAIDFAPTTAGTISGSAVLTDDNLNASAPNYTAQSIGLNGTSITGSTSTAVTSSVNPSAYGQSVTITATVIDTSGANATPTGAVQFAIDGANFGSPVALINGNATETMPTLAVGMHTVTANYENSDGNFTNSSGILTGGQVVNKATLTVSTWPTPSAITYGQTLASSTLSGGSVSYNGSAVAGTFAWTTSSTSPGAGAQTESVTFTPTDTADYSTVTGTVSVTVKQAMPTVTWGAPAAITYGTALSSTQLDATATFNGTAVPGTFTYTPAAGTVLMAGTHTLSVTFTPTDVTDYATPPAAVTSSITVNDASLTVTANNATRVYGAANPTFSGTLSGAVNGDTFTKSFSTTATSASDVGSYAIVPSVTGANLSDYTVTATNGTLTVTQAVTATTLSASATSITAGQSLTLTATVTDASAGSAGTPTGTVSFYDGSTLLGTATLSGGTATYTTSTLAPGVTHSLTASYSGSTDFAGSASSAAVSVPVAALDFSLNITGGQNQTVVPGGLASYSFQVTPTYGSYPGAVNFSVSGLPPGATATFNPSTIAANGGVQTVTMTIQTAGPGTSAKNSNPFERGSVPLVLGFLLCPLLGIRRMRKTLRSRGMVMVLLLAASLAGMASFSGCGGINGFNGQAVENYAVTVTATSGGTQHSFGVNLNVQ